MEWINNTFGSKKQNSRNIARDRLKLVLIHDRANCSTEFLEMLKNDILKVLSNYMDVEESELDIQISQTMSERNNEAVPVLYANIPIKNMRKHSVSI